MIRRRILLMCIFSYSPQSLIDAHAGGEKFREISILHLRQHETETSRQGRRIEHTHEQNIFLMPYESGNTLVDNGSIYAFAGCKEGHLVEAPSYVYKMTGRYHRSFSCSDRSVAASSFKFNVDTNVNWTNGSLTLDGNESSSGIEQSSLDQYSVRTNNHEKLVVKISGNKCKLLKFDLSGTKFMDDGPDEDPTSLGANFHWIDVTRLEVTKDTICEVK